MIEDTQDKFFNFFTNNLDNRVVLFSTDLNLTADKIISYYSCRTQIEINFRKCKQYF